MARRKLGEVEKRVLSKFRKGQKKVYSHFATNKYEWRATRSLVRKGYLKDLGLQVNPKTKRKAHFFQRVK